MLSKKLQAFINERKKTHNYWATRLKLDFALQLDKRLRLSNMNYAQLAERIESSRPYISKVLNGESNLTLESMAKLAHATGARIDIRMIDADAICDPKIWFGKVPNLAVVKPVVTTAPTTGTQDAFYKEAA